MPDTRKSRILMWKCGSLESTVCYEFIYLNRSSTGMMSKIPKKTRTQKFIMGVIVACDFCAKPTVSIDFQGKQWIVLLRNPPYLFVFQRKQWIVLVLCAGPGGCLCASDLTLQIES